MKKIISILLLIAMCLSLFAGCNKDENTNNGDNGNNTTNSGTKSDLASAKAYLQNMYQTGKKDEVMVIGADMDLVDTVVVAGVTYSVEWSVSITEGASDSVKVVDNSKLDITETPSSDILFTLTATIKDADGKTEALTFSYKIAASATAGKTPAEIVELAYALAEGEVMEGTATLTANISKLKTPYDAQYGNITIVVSVPGLEDKPIECYRLKGDKVSNDLCVGDTVTVTGSLKNYNGTIEFDAGCTLDDVVSCGIVKPTESKEIVDAAFALAGGDSLPYFCTLSGVVKSIDSEYSEQYSNITVTIQVEGTSGKKDLVCYRLKGADAAAIAVGDNITVTGVIKNYVKDETSTVEFDSGCTLDSRVAGEGGSTENPGNNDTPNDNPSVEKPTTVAGILKAAKALKEGESLPYDSTLTGMVTKVDEEYSEEFKNITVTFTVDNTEIKCYRLKVSADKIPVVGDTITVTGVIKNFYGKLEFVNCTCDKLVAGEKAPTDPKAIVEKAYTLTGDQIFEATLTAKIVQLKTPYDAKYGNMTFIVAVDGLADKPIECYRIKGDKVSNDLCVGDTVTVKGTLKNYNGTIEFDAGCTLEKVVSGGTKKPSNSKEIVDKAFTLAAGDSLPYFCTLTGTIVAKDEYSEQYNNITVTIAVEGTSGKKELVCYRLKGEGAESLKEGDTITVTGVIKNYVKGDNSTIEFDSGCTFTK